MEAENALGSVDQVWRLSVRLTGRRRTFYSPEVHIHQASAFSNMYPRRETKRDGRCSNSLASLGLIIVS